ncbi:ATP-dependent helicase, partial [bacterium]|nr:ATP-dependent helicase [bacterium]MBU1024806.1 ATP-dependent helicase [bacterium]
FGYGSSELNIDLAFLIGCGLFTIVRRQRGKIFINWTGEDIREIEDIVGEQNETCQKLLDYFDKHQDSKGHVTSKFNYMAFERWVSDQNELFQQKSPPETACEDGLLFMHERDVIKVVSGFSLLRARMKIRPDPKRIKDSYDAAYKEYEAYTKSTIAQIKAMEMFSSLLAKDKKKATGYLADYFDLEWDAFVNRYFNAKEQKNLVLPVRQEHYNNLFNTLTPNQMNAVWWSKTDANHLVLAGPGSGKTHILVLRVFQLIKVRQIPARCIALLAYNRHAAIELRRRLKILLPRDCYDIHVHTFHGLALKLVGKDRLYELQNDNTVNDIFEQLLTELIQQLNSCSGDDEHSQLRWLDRLLGIEYLLVDEFQDVSKKEYEVIKLLSRLNASNKENRVHVMAVGDDDQNLYEFRGSSVQWIRQYEEDFDIEKRIDLEHNFRSIPSVINVSSKFISQNKDRLKPADWVQKIPDINKVWINDQIVRDPDYGKIVRLKLNDITETRIAIAEEIKSTLKIYPELKHGEICIAHPTNSEAYLTKEILEQNGLKTALLGEHEFARRYERGVVEVIRQLEEMDPDKSTISFNELGSRITKCCADNKIDASWRISWDSFLDEKALDVNADYNMPVKQMLARIDEHLIGRAGQSVPEDKIASITLHKTKGLQFHTVFIFPPNMNSSIEELRRLYFVGLSRAKVKVFLVDWPECDSSLWNEMSKLSGESIIERSPIPTAQEKIKSVTIEELNHIREFNYFDTFKRGLGTGMNIFFVANQYVIKSLNKNQKIQIRSGVTSSGKVKIEFCYENKVIGMLKHDAVTALNNEIENDLERIIRVEVSQIILKDTEPDKRQYSENNEEMHYYIVPRIFYRKKT